MVKNFRPALLATALLMGVAAPAFATGQSHTTHGTQRSHVIRAQASTPAVTPATPAARPATPATPGGQVSTQRPAAGSVQAPVRPAQPAGTAATAPAPSAPRTN